MLARLLPFVAASGLLACGSPSSPISASDAHVLPDSNIRRADYAGSASCAPCHARQYEAWQDSPMRRMTRSLASTTVHAPFDGRTFSFKGDSAVMERHDGRYFLRLHSQGAEQLFAVTKTIGGRYREDFVGRLVPTEKPFGAPLDEERVLPLSWVIRRSEPRYKGYSVMVPERQHLEAGLVWRQACIFCHNTTSQLSILYDDLYGNDAPSYQGSASNALPANKAFRYAVTDAGDLRRALGAELAALGANAPLPTDAHEALGIAADVTHQRFDEQHLVELGIGCEACHGGSRAHAEIRAPAGRRLRFEATS